MDLSFLIATWGRSRYLEQCLQDLPKRMSGTRSYEILVLDNGSADNTQEVIARYPQVKNIRLESNANLNGYKILLAQGQGDYLVIVDDDVLVFPDQLDLVLTKYLDKFTDFGFLAVNVMQDFRTNGAKVLPENFTTVERDGLVVEQGPPGAWCAAMRSTDYRQIQGEFEALDLCLTNLQDGNLSRLLSLRLGLKGGIISDHYCLHASGPYFAKSYGYLHKEIEKYRSANLPAFVALYESFLG